ncbi:hypothetical protein QL285_032025 [Trifolium repens]|nr:hypothetical protein QL285_032024 [Trifolium repens]KAK2421389.1 hypothetical protein QL285_032025 [Trifolium repens]
MNSGRIFEVDCSTQDLSENRVWTGLHSNGDSSFSVALTLIPLVDGGQMQNFSENSVLGLITFHCKFSFSESSKVVSSVSKASFQVDRLTGARTRMELMIGAELGSSH